MKSVLAFLAAFATALELITDQIKKYVDAKEKQKIQQTHSNIDNDPAGAFMRKFNPEAPQATDTTSNPGERNDTT